MIPAFSLADTIVHNVQGYTSTDDGIQEFTALVFDDGGKVIATGGEDLLANNSGARQIDGGGKFMLPGLVDAHVHIESSLTPPSEFARAVVPRGVTTVITDPHEIANVVGLEGIRFMLRDA